MWSTVSTILQAQGEIGCHAALGRRLPIEQESLLMPIRSKADIEARRVAAEAKAAQPLPPPIPQVPVSPASNNVRAANPKPLRQPHPAKIGGEKRQPTGDYDVGYCRTPEKTRFKKGGKPGPGRPKGSVSQDTLLKRQLDQKQRVRINGREKNVSLRELIVTKTVMAGIEGKDRDARKYVLAEAARLYATSSDVSLPNEVTPNESDALSIAEFIQDLRDEIRAELEAEFAAEKVGSR